MNLKTILNSIKSKNILVIGDAMVDNYYYGISKRISPEAPVPILLKKENKKVLGGAANVALNLITANQNVSLMSVVGKTDSNSLIEILQANNINTDLIIRDENRCTITKTRFIGQNNSQMFRFDEEDAVALSSEIENKMIQLLEQNINKYDLIIISDYNKGTLNLNNTPKFIEIANKNNIKTLVDIKEPKYSKYYQAYIIKPNIDELSMITNMSVSTEKEIILAGKKLLENTNCKYILLTRGKDGMTLFSEEQITNFPCYSREVYDVTGAGDTVISYLAVGIANELDLTSSINISNYAAGVKVSKMGTYAVKIKDVINYISDNNDIDFENKIIEVDELVKILNNSKNKKVVFTNGCFDIFHVGHLKYLKESSRHGDILIVGVNSDKSVKRLKGPKRPIVPENERMELLASVEFVSYVVKFDEDTPYELIQKIKPDIITKAGDYKINEIVGRDIVESYGGQVIVCDFVSNKSTTNIIEKIIESYGSNE